MEPTTFNQTAASTTSSLDPQLVNLAKAFRETESGGNFNAVGKSGEYGAYQITPDTWKKFSANAGVNVDQKSATPEQQNEVAYKQLALWKKQHPDWNIGNFASAWNAGEGRPNAYQENNVGTNKYGVKYDTGAYAKSVATAYQKIKSGQQVGIDPNNPSSVNTNLAPGVPALQLSKDSSQGSGDASQPQEQGLGSQLVDRTNDAGAAISDTMSGKINPLSGLIQVGGAIGGAAGDVVNKGLELIPGVKQLEGLIGQGAGSLAQTPVGQSVVKAMQDFSSAHPELSADIGAGFNIATAIPIFKGLGVVKNLAMDGISTALKDVAEKGFSKDMADVISRGSAKTGTAFLEKNPTVIKEMVDRRLIPSIEDGKYQTGDLVNKSWSTIKDTNAQVKSALDVSKYTSVGEDSTPILEKAVSAYPNSEFTPTDILDNAKELTPQNNALWKKFEAGQASMADVNTLRSDLDQAVKSVYAQTAQAPIKKDMGAQLASVMRDFVQENAPETKDMFSEMRTQFNIQKALKFIQGKPVKSGIVGDVIKGAASAGGEAAGNATGIPFAGAIGGYRAGSYAAKKLGGGLLKRAILDRTGINAVRTGGKTALKGLIKLGAGSLAQKATNHQ